MATQIEYGIVGHTKKVIVNTNDNVAIRQKMYQFIRAMKKKGYALNEIMFVYSPAQTVTTLASIHHEYWKGRNHE